MQVQLVRRWGPYRAGRTVDVGDVQGRWLVQHNFGTAAGVASPVQRPVAEGAHGADPLAGGDATRRRPSITHAERDPEVNVAAPGEGVPPTYRPGYGAEDRARERRAGRRVSAAQNASEGPSEGDAAERPAAARRRRPVKATDDSAES